MPGWSPVGLYYIYRDLVGIIVKAKCGSLGILVHSLRNKIPIVGNQGESEVGSIEGWRDCVDYALAVLALKIRALYTNPPGFS